MKVSRIKFVVIAFASLVALAFPALASAQGAIHGSSGFLLFQKEIRTELALTPEQIEKVEKAIGEFSQDMGGGRTIIRMTPGMDIADVDKALLGPLKTEQKKRLREIWIQFNNGKILAEPAIQKELGLTAKQKEQVQDVQAWYSDEMRELASTAGEGMVMESEDLRKRTSGRFLAILTTEQKKKLEELKGKPYEFKKLKKG